MSNENEPKSGSADSTASSTANSSPAAASSNPGERSRPAGASGTGYASSSTSSTGGFRKPGTAFRSRNRFERNDGDSKGSYSKRGSFFKAKKECYFTKNHVEYIDYKDTDVLKRFLGKNGRILPRRVTGTKMIYQRMLANAVKRARYMALLPFVGSIWSQEYYEQQSREFLERKKQSQVRAERNVEAPQAAEAPQATEAAADIEIQIETPSNQVETD